MVSLFFEFPGFSPALRPQSFFSGCLLERARVTLSHKLAGKWSQFLKPYGNHALLLGTFYYIVF